MNKLYLIIPLFLISPIFVTEKAFNEEHVTNIPLKDIIYIDAETQRRAETIKKKESGGNCNGRGADGEIGCYQIMPNTWKALTKKHLGEVRGYSTSTEEFIVYKELQSLGNLKPQQVFLRWNAGGAKKCSKGITKIGKVPYNSCAYVNDSMKIYNSLQTY